MNYLKQLAGQTIIYGLGIVVPRLLNYLLLTPFYTRIFSRAEYGIITELYAYVVFLIVILTYGMETGFFRYASEKKDPDVYKTCLISLFSTSFFFSIVAVIFHSTIARAIGYEGFGFYILLLMVIVAIDSFASIPFALLRLKNKARKYALIRVVEVSVNIFFNLFFLIYCENNVEQNALIQKFYFPEYRVGYVLVSNLLASLIKLILLIPDIFITEGRFTLGLLRLLLKYSYPLLIAGMAGTVNEAIDRVLLKYRLGESDNPMEQLGVYGANYKLAVLMTLFIQMFRYAAEPFFFSKMNEKNAREIYAQVLKYFVFFGVLIFLSVTLFIDVFRLFIGNEFREGVFIVPVILVANLCMGIYYNLSVWFKLTNKTNIGAAIVLFGALITFFVNFIFIPDFGYRASAWGHLISYSAMVLISFVMGRKYYKIPYDLPRILLLILAGLFIFLVFSRLQFVHNLRNYLVNIVVILIYIWFFIRMEKIDILKLVKKRLKRVI